jgi:hypothetical protein
MYSRQGYGINSQTALGAAYILNYKGCLNAKVQLRYKLGITSPPDRCQSGRSISWV